MYAVIFLIFGVCWGVEGGGGIRYSCNIFIYLFHCFDICLLYVQFVNLSA